MISILLSFLFCAMLFTIVRASHAKSNDRLFDAVIYGVVALCLGVFFFIVVKNLLAAIVISAVVGG